LLRPIHFKFLQAKVTEYGETGKKAFLHGVILTLFG